MLARSLVAALLVSTTLAGCSDGATVETGNNLPVDNDTQTDEIPDGSGSFDAPQTVSADEALSRIEATRAINDPLNTMNEPLARAWTGVGLQARKAECADGPQNAADAFATASFMLETDDDGEYLVSAAPSDSQTPEYIEFCLNVPELARYRIITQVKAPSVDADSFFVTVNEDEAGTVPNPGIYDVSRSEQFKEDRVRSRTQNPLITTLSPGTVTIRFYAREANTAIRLISLEAEETDTPVLDPDNPDTTAIAQCSANTGIPEEEIDSLIQQYLGNVSRRFVLAPADEERGYTIRNDYQWLTANGSANIMCLAPPPEGGTNLIDNTVPDGRIVFGSVGRDEQRLNTPLRGVFIGNGGGDEIGVIEGGVFIAGEGDNKVTTMLGGLFEGGPDDDLVNGIDAGTFNGGAGSDRVITLAGGTFNGGAGNDSVERRSELAIIDSVEDSGILFSTLQAPANLQFVDSTQLSTVVTWQASADERVDGYVISQPDDVDEVTRLVDLGLAPVNLGRSQTYGTEVAIDLVPSAQGLIQLRAYAELSDGSYQYSEPLGAIYVAPAAPTDAVVASSEVVFSSGGTSYEGVVLADDGAVVQVNFRSPSNGNVPAFVSFDANIKNPQQIFNETLTDNSFRAFNGKTRQYMVSGRQYQNLGASVLAFSGDAKTVLWEQELAKETSSGGTAECQTGIVTQDDWLVCVVTGGGLRAFDPQGTLYSHLSSTIQTNQSIVDGDIGTLVSWPQENASDFVVMDLISGEQGYLTSDIADYLPGTGEWSVHALAVTGDQVIVAGAQEYACTAENDIDCLLRGNSPENYFLTQVELSTGLVSNFSLLPIRSRPVAGTQFFQTEKVGRVTGDAVAFYYGDVVARYSLGALDELQRQFVPGRVQDVSADLTLTQEAIVGDNGVTTGYELFLVGR